MHTLTCRPRTFAVFAATILFVVLATPIWLTAQVEQEHPKDQTNYFVKNLDTLDDTWTVAKCMSNASPVFADTRPGAPERADSSPPYYGACAVNSHYRLTGECVNHGLLGFCNLRYNPEACPPGLFVPRADRAYMQCLRNHTFLVDNRRGCN